MKVFFKYRDYEQWIDMQTGKFCCSCMDFQIRQLSKTPIGKCKHIEHLFGLIDKELFTLVKEGTNGTGGLEEK